MHSTLYSFFYFFYFLKQSAQQYDPDMNDMGRFCEQLAYINNISPSYIRHQRGLHMFLMVSRSRAKMASHVSHVSHRSRLLKLIRETIRLISFYTSFALMTKSSFGPKKKKTK